MRRLFGVPLLLAIAALSLSCTKADNKVVARIGEDAITVKMIEDDYLAMSPAARPDLKTIDEKEAFAKDIVAKEVLKREAQKRGLDRLPEVAQGRQDALMRKAWQTFYEEMVRGKVNIAEKDLQDLFAKDKYDYQMGWIFVRSKQLAEEIEGRLKQGEDFGKLASAFSIDPSRAQNGDIGLRAPGTMPGPIDEKLTSMSPGETSGIIPYDTYYVIVKVYAKQEREATTFDQARDGLEAMIRANGENTRQREIIAQMKKDYDLTFNEAAVDLIVAKTKALYPAADVPPGKIPEFSDEEQDRELARWKGGTWKVKNYMDSINGLPDYVRPGYGADTGMVKSVIGDFVTGELWKAEISNKGYETRPEAVRAGERAVEEAIITALHDDLTKDVTLDDVQLQTFYDEHKQELITEPETRIAVIIAADDPGAKAIYDQLQAGANFADLAKTKSIDAASGQNGGELARPLYKEEIEQMPDLQQVLDTLKVGTYSAPMPVPVGFGPAGSMVVRLLERIEPRQMLFDEIKEPLHERALQLEQDKKFSDWLKARMDEYKVEIFPDALSVINFEDLKQQGA